MADILELAPDNDTNVSLNLGTPGLTVTAIVSASKTVDGTAIHADLTPTITESSPGVYSGVIQGSAITARLKNATPTSYTGKLVYLIWKVGTDFHSYRTCLVRDSRMAE